MMKEKKNTRGYARRYPCRVLCSLEKPSAKKSRIVMTIRINQKRVKWSTGEYTLTGKSNWNRTTKRAVIPVGGKPETVRARKEAEGLNERLRNYENEATDLYRRWKMSNPAYAETISPAKFRLELDYLTEKQLRPKAKAKLVSTDFIKFAESWRDKQKDKAGKAKSTFVSINAKVNHLRKFADKHHGGVVTFDEVDDTFVEQFKAYLFREAGQASQTVSRTMITLRAIVKRAANRKLLDLTDELESSLVHKFRKTPKVIFYREDLEKLINLDLTGREDLEHTRDLFLIGVLTGQRISDFMRLSPVNFKSMGEGKFRFEIFGQIKTAGAVAGGYIFPWGVRFLKKYGYIGGGEFEPYTETEQTFRRKIKEISSLVFGDATFTVYRDGEKADMIGTEVLKSSLVSSHTARRTCASLLIMMGMTLHDVSKFTGHKKPQQLVDYDQIEAEVRAMGNVDLMDDAWGKMVLRAV